MTNSRRTSRGPAVEKHWTTQRNVYHARKAEYRNITLTVNIKNIVIMELIFDKPFATLIICYYST
jgi:hypothetical protein